MICINYPPHRTCIVNVSNTVSTLFVPRFHSVNNYNFIDIFCSKNLYFDWSFKLKVAEQCEICKKFMKTLRPRQWLIYVAVIVNFAQILHIASNSDLLILQLYMLNLASSFGE